MRLLILLSSIPVLLLACAGPKDPAGGDSSPDTGQTDTGDPCTASRWVLDDDGDGYGVETCGDGVDGDCDGADTTCAWSGEVDLGGFVKLHGSGAGDDAGRLTDVADVTGDGVDDLFVTTFGAGGYAGGGYLVPGPVTGSATLDAAGYAFEGDRDATYGAGRRQPDRLSRCAGGERRPARGSHPENGTGTGPARHRAGAPDQEGEGFG